MSIADFVGRAAGGWLYGVTTHHPTSQPWLEKGLSMRCPASLSAHRLVALLGTLTVVLGSSGCFLWAFHERNKAMERQKKVQATVQADYDKCKATIATLVRVPDAAPAARIDGDWQCMYTAALGDQFVESLTFSISGKSVAVTGRDNWNNNVIADGQLGGRVVAFQPAKDSVVNVTIDPSGRMLDGRATYWYPDGPTCHETRYRCRRRY